MTPDDTGRYCHSCKKSVIDFTDKTDSEIQLFFSQNMGEPVCGRFKNTQIDRIIVEIPEDILNRRLPLWMRFLVACMVIFGISIFPFESSLAGKPANEMSYYQGGPIVKTKKIAFLHLKKEKKKRRKNKAAIWFPGPEILTIAGYTQTDRIPPISILSDSSFPPDYISIVKAGAADEPKPYKESPGPVPHNPVEFILPAVLSIRKETGQNTVD